MNDFSQSFLYAFSTFLPVIDPFAGALFFLSMTAGVSSVIRKKITDRMAFFSLIVLLVSLFAGRIVLSFFGISLPVLRVGGGIVLFFAGWNALNAPAHAESQNNISLNEKSEAELLSMAFYPLTLPLITGPGTIAVAAAIGSSQINSPGDVAGTVLAAVSMTMLTWICFRFSDKIPKALGNTGADALVRLFSFILLCLGLSMMWEGISGLIATLPR